jgi:hypothetical protein
VDGGGMSMSEQTNFFSDKHSRLLRIADTSKILAGIVLGAHLLWAILQVFQYQSLINSYGPMQMNILDFLRNNPLEIFRLTVNMSTIALRGVVYYLVLRCVSLGLNMIVETDINYREKGVLQHE